MLNNIRTLDSCCRQSAPSSSLCGTQESFWSKCTAKEKAILATLLGCNVAVFVLWQAPCRQVQGFMHSHFVFHQTPAPFKAATAFSASHSHQKGIHLVTNALAMTSMVPLAIKDLGAIHSMLHYVIAGPAAYLLSNYLRVALSYLLGRHLLSSTSVGASGALCSLLAVSALRHPDRRETLWFLPMFPSLRAITVLQIIAGLDLLSILSDKSPLHAFDALYHQDSLKLDHYTHLGGLLFGALYGLLLKHILNRVGPVRLTAIFLNQYRCKAAPRFTGRGYRLDGKCVGPIVPVVPLVPIERAVALKTRKSA